MSLRGTLEQLILTLPSKGLFLSLFDGFSGKAAALRRFTLPSEVLDFLASVQWSLDAASYKADPATRSNPCSDFLWITVAELSGFASEACHCLDSMSSMKDFAKRCELMLMDFACL